MAQDARATIANESLPWPHERATLLGQRRPQMDGGARRRPNNRQCRGTQGGGMGRRQDRTMSEAADETTRAETTGPTRSCDHTDSRETSRISAHRTMERGRCGMELQRARADTQRRHVHGGQASRGRRHERRGWRTGRRGDPRGCHANDKIRDRQTGTEERSGTTSRRQGALAAMLR